MFFFFKKSNTARKGRLKGSKSRNGTKYPFTSDMLATATGDRLSWMLGHIADTACRMQISKIPFGEYEDCRQEAILWMLKYSVPKLKVGSNAISFCLFAASSSVRRMWKIRNRDAMRDSVGGADHFAERELQNDEEPPF